ncbi:MAG: hypothetical protein LBL67_04155 [Coriobacteriales bacterium]|jgi:hypothetical protein|nr:hypothetical protein [Coriobacteriales bacterium]
MYTLEQRYQEIFYQLDGDLTSQRRFYQQIQHSTAIYHGEPVEMGFLPKIYDLTDRLYFAQVIDQMWQILDKCTREYLDNPDYRKLFGFSDTIEQLICLPVTYNCTIPVGRFDIFYDDRKRDFRFCEINTDGASAMNEDRECAAALVESAAYRRFVGETPLCAQELFQPFIAGILRCYLESKLLSPDHGHDEARAEQGVDADGGACDHSVHDHPAKPRIAIIDYLERGTVAEFEQFRQRFEEAGYPCLVADVGQLRYHDEQLWVAPSAEALAADPLAIERPLDLVYRRCVTSEFADGLASAGKGEQALVEAVRARRVCLVGHFASQVAHSKMMFRVLHLPETFELLTPSERRFVHRHVPLTARLSEDELSLERLTEHRERWIIKPCEGYASAGVYAGRDYGASEWEQLLRECADTDYLAQRFVRQPQTENLALRPPFAADQQDHLSSFNTLTGLFCVRGEFVGSHVRASGQSVFSGYHDGVCLASMITAEAAAFEGQA